MSDADSPAGAPRDLYHAPRQEAVRPPAVGRNAPRVSDTAGDSALPGSSQRARDTAAPADDVSNSQPRHSDEPPVPSAVPRESSALSTPTRAEASGTTAHNLSEDRLEVSPGQVSPGQVSPRGQRTPPVVYHGQDFDVPQTPSELLSHLGIGYYSKVGDMLMASLKNQGRALKYLEIHIWKIISSGCRGPRLELGSAG